MSEAPDDAGSFEDGTSRTTPAADGGNEKESRRPFAEGFFTLPSSPSEKARLIGCHCRDCGAHFYPRRMTCLNCHGRHIEDKLLSAEGKLQTFTVFRQAPASGIMTPPYAVGQIELPEAVIVTSVLTGCDFTALEIGIDMEMVVEEVMKDQDGTAIVAFKFRPT
jgi:uncharacterized OB-fold protein